MWIAFTISSLMLLISCSDNNGSGDESSQPADTQTFTFFELGKTTRLTKGVRSDLRDKLGHDAIERRSILNLEINRKGFLKTYLPDLAVLNEQLNYPPRERIEHNTVKLMYRYARKKSVPFELVELLFSDYTSTLLLIKINFKVDEANTIETLQEKYGRPEIINWDDENGQSMYWKKSSDLLIVSRIPDRFGKIEHQIVIYFVDNLKLLIDTERKEREKKEQQRTKTGKKAF
ncbi:MAG: hypothetical protein GY850_22725 [bacterium]|nr:hypothetical protein [bacterium]